MKARTLLASLAFLLLGTLISAASPKIRVITTFDYPGTGNLTHPQKINDSGDVAGDFVDSSGATRGFMRFRDGTFSAPIVEPNDTGNVTAASGINESGTVVGYYIRASDSTAHGFLLSDGIFSGYDVPGSTSTYIYGLNDLGDFSGRFDGLGFYRPANGGGFVAVIAINVAIEQTAYGLTSTDVTVGNYVDLGSVSHGFLREVDGNFTLNIDPPGSVATIVFDINDQRWVVGRFQDSTGATHAFFSDQTLSRFVVFDYPGSAFTSFNGINRRGVICGSYRDNAGIDHGFLARVRRTP